MANSIASGLAITALTTPIQRASAAGLPRGFMPQLPPVSGRKLVPIVDVGISGQTFPEFLQRANLVPPPARDAIEIEDRLFTVRIGNDRAYQSQDYAGGRPSSEFKSRAEIDTMRMPETAYQNGMFRAYRIMLKLERSWFFDPTIAIITQFKPFGGGPDLFIGVKRHDIVLRVGPEKSSFASQTTILKDVDVEKWIEIVMLVDWSVGSAGKVELFYRYVDKAKLNAVGTVTGQNMQPAKGNYAKFGIYKPQNFPTDAPLSATQIVRIAGFSIFRDAAGI